MIPAAVLISIILLLAPTLSGVPDEPLWSSWLCALAMLAVISVVTRRGQPAAGNAEKAFATLLGIALLSLLARMVAERGIAYSGPMLRAWTTLATDFALFALARRLAVSGRAAAYALALAAVVASGIVADVGVNEFLQHRHDPEPWRVFATSTPDFLAGYLVLLLPPTLALLVAVPLQRQRRPLIGIALAVLLLVVFSYQAVTLLKTQSRFALVSLAVGALVFVVSLWRAKQGGLTLERSSWQRLIGIGLFVLLIGAVAAKPVLNRLRHTSAGDNSTAFRLYTYRGSLKMAAANPVLGTGIGTYVFSYPRYAMTGFSRLTHESYLQMADECGVPGLVALLLTLGFSLATAARGLVRAPDTAPIAGHAGEFLATITPGDDRVLVAGLLGGLCAGIVQNLIDSDWYVFFFGTTFWTLAGLAVGLASSRASAEASKATKTVVFPTVIGTLAALIFVRMATQGVAASFNNQATAADVLPSTDATAAAEQGWAEAAHWDPLNAHYPSYLGFRVYFLREKNLTAAETQLRRAIDLEPSSLNYASLATLFTQERRFPEAIQALKDGLRNDPVSDTALDMRLRLAQLLPPPQAVEYCRQITRLEDSPVGTVRAIGGTVPQQFAIADSGVADAAFAANDSGQARVYYARAAKVLETYADQGGTANIQRQVMMGDRPDPTLDDQMGRLYDHVISQLIALTPPNQRPTLEAQAQTYGRKFAEVFAKASRMGTQ